MPRGVFKRTKSAWNKGLTKYTDDRVKKGGIKTGKSKLGTKATKETKEKMSLIRSLAHKEGRMLLAYKNISKAKKGINRDEKTKRKIASTLKGRKLPEKTKEKIRQAHKGKHRGKNSNFWKGGTSSLVARIRNCIQYKEWRERVFKRDNYICQKCNYSKGGILEGHHIKSLSTIIEENNITTLEQALACKELWDIDNGQTLCIYCHRLTNNYGNNLIRAIKI